MSRANGIGCKGGTSATANRKAAVYDVILPTDEIVEKRTFFPIDGEARGYGWQREDGSWRVAAIDVPNCERFSHYTQMLAQRIK